MKSKNINLNTSILSENTEKYIAIYKHVQLQFIDSFNLLSAS